MLSDDDRLVGCWRIQDCNNCLKSDYRCGWCPYSSTCIPANSLLDPVTRPGVCPHWAERWELRTRPLGCYCSTITFLTSLVTILCTIVGLFLLYGVWRLLSQIVRTWGIGSASGSRISIDDHGHRREGTWRRPGWSRPSWLYRRLSD